MSDVTIILEPGELPTGDNPKAFIKKTNSQGVVSFSGVRRGIYTASIKELVPPAWWEVIVTAHAPDYDSNPLFEWPVVQHVVRTPLGVVLTENGSGFGHVMPQRGRLGRASGQRGDCGASQLDT